jgi:hypothetical protein
VEPIGSIYRAGNALTRIDALVKSPRSKPYRRCMPTDGNVLHGVRQVTDLTPLTSGRPRSGSKCLVAFITRKNHCATACSDRFIIGARSTESPRGHRPNKGCLVIAQMTVTLAPLVHSTTRDPPLDRIPRFDTRVPSSAQQDGCNLLAYNRRPS